jgi:hypothetical protein
MFLPVVTVKCSCHNFIQPTEVILLGLSHLRHFDFIAAGVNKFPVFGKDAPEAQSNVLLKDSSEPFSIAVYSDLFNDSVDSVERCIPTLQP